MISAARRGVGPLAGQCATRRRTRRGRCDRFLGLGGGGLGGLARSEWESQGLWETIVALVVSRAPPMTEGSRPACSDHSRDFWSAARVVAGEVDDGFVAEFERHGRAIIRTPDTVNSPGGPNTKTRRHKEFLKARVDGQLESLCVPLCLVFSCRLYASPRPASCERVLRGAPGARAFSKVGIGLRDSPPGWRVDVAAARERLRIVDPAGDGFG
jgi:hypothetical protein